MSVTTLLETPWFRVEADETVCAGDLPFYRFVMAEGAAVLPVTGDGRLILIDQYRPAIRRRTLELPAGMVAPGETPEQAIERELHEETGYRCRELRRVGAGGIRLEREQSHATLFVALGCERDPAFVPAEDIRVVLVTPAEFRQLVLDGRFDHLVGLAIVLLAGWTTGLTF